LYNDIEVDKVNCEPGREVDLGHERSLSAIRGLRGTGASMHNGNELPTRGFSVSVAARRLADNRHTARKYHS
jgi:hypothetical protein